MPKNEPISIYPYLLGCLFYNALETLMHAPEDFGSATPAQQAAYHAIVHTPIHKLSMGLEAYVQTREDISFPWWNYDKNEFVPGWISSQLGIII